METDDKARKVEDLRNKFLKLRGEIDAASAVGERVQVFNEAASFITDAAKRMPEESLGLIDDMRRFFHARALFFAVEMPPSLAEEIAVPASDEKTKRFEKALLNAIRIDKWNEPSLLTTAHALHVVTILRDLNLVERDSLTAELESLRSKVLIYVAACYLPVKGQFAFNTRNGYDPSLYSTRSALSILKIENRGKNNKPLTREVAEEFFKNHADQFRNVTSGKDEVFSGHRAVDSIIERARELLSRVLKCEDDQCTVFELDSAIAILWNLGFLGNLDQSKGAKLARGISEYITKLWKEDPELPAFSLSPSSSSRCVTACLFAARIVRFLTQDCPGARDVLTQLKERFEQVRPFIMACWAKRDGGFAFTPGGRSNMLHTWLAMSFARHTDWNQGQEVSHLLDSLESFAAKCSNDGGFGFYPGDTANAHATRSVLQIEESLENKYATGFLISASRAQEIRGFIHKLKTTSGVYRGLLPAR